MRIDEARTLLEVDSSTTRDEVRRAYLRMLKKYKPERDPTGFERLRKAYELALSFAPPGEAAPRRTDQPDVPPIVVLRSDAPREKDVEPPEPPPVEPPREAEPWEGCEVIHDPLSDALDAARSGDAPRAERYALDAIRHAERSPGAPVPSSHAVRDVVLTLYVDGEHQRARRITTSYDAYLRASGLEARVLGSGDAALRWVFVRELGSLPLTFPDEALVVIAKALLEHAPEDMLLAVDDLFLLDRSTYERAARQLGKHAPSLAAALADVLPAAVQPTDWVAILRAAMPVLRVAIPLIVLLLLQMCR